MAIAKVINISITGLWFRNLICLNIKEVRDPKIIPIPTDTNPSKKNCPMIIKGVAAVMSELITLSTAPKDDRYTIIEDSFSKNATEELGLILVADNRHSGDYVTRAE